MKELHMAGLMQGIFISFRWGRLSKVEDVFHHALAFARGLGTDFVPDGKGRKQDLSFLREVPLPVDKLLKASGKWKGFGGKQAVIVSPNQSVLYFYCPDGSVRTEEPYSCFQIDIPLGEFQMLFDRLGFEEWMAFFRRTIESSDFDEAYALNVGGNAERIAYNLPSGNPKRRKVRATDREPFFRDLHWITFYDDRRIDAYGRELLLSAPWSDVIPVKGGIIFCVQREIPHLDSREWQKRFMDVIAATKFLERCYE